MTCGRGRFLCLIALMAVSIGAAAVTPVPAAASSGTVSGIHKIKHVVIIMQENRSFDSYFGTFPGADGIPGLAGNPGHLPCSEDSTTDTCVASYHDTADLNHGGPHDLASGVGDIAGGAM